MTRDPLEDFESISLSNVDLPDFPVFREIKCVTCVDKDFTSSFSYSQEEHDDDDTIDLDAIMAFDFHWAEIVKFKSSLLD